MSEKKQENPIEGKYANVFNVGFNSVEFVLEFGQSYEDSGQTIINTRIITSPVYIKELIKLLNESVCNFESRYTIIDQLD